MDEGRRIMTPPHSPPQPPTATAIASRLHKGNQARNETLSLLKTVQFEHEVLKDEELGISEKQEPKRDGLKRNSRFREVGVSSSFPTRCRPVSCATASTYSDWHDDPFYADISPFSTDDEEESKKMLDECDKRITTAAGKREGNAAVANGNDDGGLGGEEESPESSPDRHAHPERCQPRTAPCSDCEASPPPRRKKKRKQTATLSLLQFAKTNLDTPNLASLPPNPNTNSFRSKALGTTTWSPRHSNVAGLAKDLPSFSSLVRVAERDRVQVNTDQRSPGMMHPIALPLSNDTATAAVPRTTPLRQVIYDFDVQTPAGQILSNPSQSTTLSIIEGPSSKLKKSALSVTILTPEMSQYAKLPKSGGRLLGKGGVQFFAQGNRNPKRSFFTFKFDETLTTDENEIQEMEEVRNLCAHHMKNEL